MSSPRPKGPLVNFSHYSFLSISKLVHEILVTHNKCIKSLFENALHMQLSSGAMGLNFCLNPCFFSIFVFASTQALMRLGKCAGSSMSMSLVPKSHELAPMLILFLIKNLNFLLLMGAIFVDSRR